MIWLLSGAWLGWSLGANDTSNIFGTAVSTKMISFWRAALLTAVFVALGALLEGSAGMHTLKGLTTQTIQSSFIIALSAALVVTLMTVFKLPVSTSQAVVGAIIGKGLYAGGVNWSGLLKVVICWIATPIGGILISIGLYLLLDRVLRRLRLSILNLDAVLRWGMIIVGCYGAYALGANNVANVTGVYLGLDAELGVLATPFWLSAIGAATIGLGVVTYSRRVMETVGNKLVRMTSFGAFIAVLSHSITVHVFAIIGVPVSSSQAIVGAVLGIGLLKGGQNVKFSVLRNIVIGWISTPLIAGGLSYAICRLFSIA